MSHDDEVRLAQMLKAAEDRVAILEQENEELRTGVAHAVAIGENEKLRKRVAELEGGSVECPCCQQWRAAAGDGAQGGSYGGHRRVHQEGGGVATQGFWMVNGGAYS